MTINSLNKLKLVDTEESDEEPSDSDEERELLVYEFKIVIERV